jgi:tetratricopeptide (TPR) repeat protein
VPSDAELKNLVSLYNRNLIAEALAEGERLLANSADDPSLNNMVGVLHARLNHVDKALAQYDRALSLRPRYAEAFNNRGNLLTRLGRLDDAIASFREAVSIIPNYAVAYNNLGNALHEAGKPEEAVQSLQEALRLQPGYADAHNNLGNALLALGQHQEAAQNFARALQLQPDMAKSLVGHGKALNALGFHREAAENIEKAIRINPGVAAWHNELGNALSDLGRVEAAIEQFRAALELDPEFAEASSNLGNALSDLGNFDEAVTRYEEALRIKPGFAEARYNLSLVRKYADGDDDIRALRELTDDEQQADRDRCYLSFALGKAYEDVGDYDRSFRYYAQGNRLRKKELNYDIGRDREQLEQIRALFETSERTIGPDDAGNDSSRKRPVFIVGMPRSGTTLVEQILASHSEVHGAGELHTASRILVPILQAFEASPARGIDAQTLARIGDEYLRELDYLAGTAPVVTDKMPGNFLWTGFLLTAMPRARIVNVRRNPAATCWSMFRRLFGSNGFTNDLVDLGTYYGMYEDLMRFWHGTFPGRIYDLDYEALTEDQEQQTRALLEYCELPWEDACLEFHATRRAVRTPSGSQVRQKMYKGSSEAWRRYEAHLEPLLSTLEATL